MQTIEIQNCAACQIQQESLWAHATAEDLVRIGAAKTCSWYKPGDVIFAEGEQPHGLFCIHSGKLKLVRKSLAGVDQIVQFVGPGDVFGYRSILGRDPLHTSAIALDNCRVCRLPARILSEAVIHNPALALRLMRIFSHDAAREETSPNEMFFDFEAQCVALAVLVMHQHNGLNSEFNGQGLRVSLEELATLSTTSLESTNRVLHEFQRCGLIQFRENQIRILQHRILIEIADPHA
jgi:CRP/FNR family transcriptional regulator